MLHLLYINEYIQSICLYRPPCALLPAYRMSILLPIQLYIFVLFIYMVISSHFYLSSCYFFTFSIDEIYRQFICLFIPSYSSHIAMYYRQHYLWLMIVPRKEKLLTFFHSSIECISFDTTQIL